MASREYQTKAVVIRKTRLGEADRIITLFTPDLGKLQGVAKAVRKPKSKLSGHLELLTYSQVNLVRGKNLDTITGSQTINSFLPLRSSLELTSTGLYMAELVNLFTADADRIDNQQLFSLLVSVLQQLCQQSDSELCTRYFELHMLSLTGYRPELKGCSVCQKQVKPVANIFNPFAGGILCEHCSREYTFSPSLSLNGQKVLRFLQESDLPTALRLKIPAELNSEIERILRSYCRFILEKEVKSALWLDGLKSHPPGGTLYSVQPH